MYLLDTLNKKIGSISLIALSILLLISALSLLSIQRLRSSAQSLRKGQVCLEKLQTTLYYLKDVETGTRGFLITDNAEFLQTYERAIRDLPDLVSSLPDHLIAANNVTVYFPRLDSLIRQKLSLSHQLISGHTQEKLPLVAQQARLGEAKRRMDQIRALIATIQDEERALLAIGEEQHLKIIGFTTLLIIWGSLLAILCPLLAMMLIKRDIHIRRGAEEKLLRSEGLLNEAQRIAKMGSWEYEVEKECLMASAGLFATFEVDPRQHLETVLQFFGYLHPEDREHLQQLIEACIASGESFQTEYRILLAEGKQKHILSYVTPLKDGDGKVRIVRGTCQDITDLKYVQQALIHSEKLFSTIFKLNPFPTAITRLWDGKVLIANEKALQMFGYSLQEASTLTTVELKLWNTVEERQTFVTQLKEHSVLEFEKRYQSKEGKQWDAMTYIEKIEWDGEPCLLIILQDITARKRAQEAKQAYWAQLEKLNASKDKFFSIIAHDLLSPLNGVLGSADLLRAHMDQLSPTEIQTLSHTIHLSTTHLKKLLTNLLEWARMQKGELKFQPMAVNLFMLVGEEIAALQETAQQKSISIETVLPEQMSVIADEHMLRSVLRNLLANAIKFSSMGDCIYIRGKKLETSFEVSVSDQGIGMSKGVQESLFQLDVKQTSIGTAGEKGTGLGLMLCKEFVEKHGGHIWVESKEKQGSTFYFSLPLSL